MNVLIINSMLNFAGGKGEALSRFSAENREHTEKLCRELSALGENLLLIRAKPKTKSGESSFSFREKDGFSELYVPVSEYKELPLKALRGFNALLSANAESLSGLFKPDFVICSDPFPFAICAAAKIAGISGGILLTESSCNPRELLLRTGAVRRFNPVLKKLDRAFIYAQKASEAVIGLYPGAQRDMKSAERLYPMPYPHDRAKALPPESAAKLRDAISSFREGGGFCLCCPLLLETGYPAAELISACGELGEKFALVLTGSGAQTARYKKFAAEKGITNCFFLDEIPREELPFALSGTSAVFLSENSVLKGEAAEQSTFLTAMESGLPVLAAAENYSEFFRESTGAVIVKPKNRESLRLGLRSLLKMSTEDLETLGGCSKEFAGSYPYSKYSEDILNIIKEIQK